MSSRLRSAPKPPAAPLPRLSFRAFVEDASFLGACPVGEGHTLAETMSPAMMAIIDAIDGYPEHIDPQLSQAIFACHPSALPRERRRTIVVSAGGRGGKSSRLGATLALYLAWTVPLTGMAPGEVARVAIVAPDRDLAEQDLDYVRGYAEESPILSRAMVAGPRGDMPKSYVRLRRPDGQLVDIRVATANRGGKSVRARNLCGVILDEASFFYTADSGSVTSDRDIYRAAIQRVVPGGQIVILSTPWIAEQGLLEERIKSETAADGTRRHERTLCVARVGTRMLNPAWDPTGEIEADMRADDPENADREIGAIPLAAGTSVFFPPEVVARCFELPAWPTSRISVGHGFDGGFTSDCLAAAAVGRHAGGFDWFDAFELRPARGAPLVPSVAVGAVGTWVRGSGGKACAADSHYKESVKEHFATAGVQFIEAPDKVSSFTALRSTMAEGRFRISIPDPVLRERVKAQLRSITKKPNERGGITISAPRRKTGPTGGTTHGDLVSAGVLAAWRAGAGKAVRSGGVERALGAGGLRKHGGTVLRCARGMHPVKAIGERCARCYPAPSDGDTVQMVS